MKKNLLATLAFLFGFSTMLAVSPANAQEQQAQPEYDLAHFTLENGWTYDWKTRNWIGGKIDSLPGIPTIRLGVMKGILKVPRMLVGGDVRTAFWAFPAPPKKDITVVQVSAMPVIGYWLFGNRDEKWFSFMRGGLGPVCQLFNLQGFDKNGKETLDLQVKFGLEGGIGAVLARRVSEEMAIGLGVDGRATAANQSVGELNLNLSLVVGPFPPSK